MDDLPIATHPVFPRDHCRLMAVNRESGSQEALYFYDIIRFFKPGDCLILNNSGVFPARILFKQDSREGEVLLQKIPVNGEAVLAKMQGRWAKRLAKNSAVEFSKGSSGSIEVLGFDEAEGAYRVCVHAQKPLDVLGQMPLPPYIEKRRMDAGEARVEEKDRETYQTVYSQDQKSLAAPTAGLHWTPELLEKVEARGVAVVKITMHLGFASTIRAEGLEELPEESYHVTKEAADCINERRSKGGRVFACGTSVVRTLESIADGAGKIPPAQGLTKLFIKGDYRFRAFDALITNFHIPDSTHFFLTQAFAGSKIDLAALYRQAAQSGFRFYSYGDAMLLF